MANQRSVTLDINGKRVTALTGETLLSVLRREGISVPTLCYDERLAPHGGCRMCLVARRDGGQGLVASCYTPVQRGMVIETDTEDVMAARRRQLQLLILDHRMECPVCERSGDCRLQDLVYEYGIEEAPLSFSRPTGLHDTASAVIARDNEKCVLCAKCVRLCSEVQGIDAIGIFDRGLTTHVSTAGNRPLDCEFCGQCVHACPVGALVAKPFVSDVPVWLRESTATTCSYCSCGCLLRMESYEGEIQRVTPLLDGSPNNGKLCAKGWLGWDITTHPERLKHPMIRKDRQLVEAGWEEALEVTIAGLRRAQERNRAITGLATPRLTNEDAYLFQRLFRSVFGSPHVGAGSAPGISALVDGVRPAYGITRSTASFKDLASADAVMVLCADPTRTHPLIKTELVQGIMQRGQKLLLAHALSGGLQRQATIYLPLHPGTEETLVLGLAHVLVRKLHGRRDGAPQPVGFAEFRKGLEQHSPRAVGSITGLQPDEIRAAAGLLASVDNVVVVVLTGSGIPGDEAAVARRGCELLSLLGCVDGPGRGILVMGEKANTQGVVEVGLHPALLPGSRLVANDDDRAACEAVWKTSIPALTGWNSEKMLQAAAGGKVGFFYLVGQDPVGDWRSGSLAREALERADFVIVQDAFLTASTQFADVVLPAAILSERIGHFIAADGMPRELQRTDRPPGSILQDGQIFLELAGRCGAAVSSGPALREEMRRLVRDPRGVSPQPKLSPPGALPEPRVMNPFFLDLSPQLFHSGSTTMRSALLKEFAPPVSVLLSPRDADAIGISDGAMVRLTVGDNQILLRGHIDASMREGTIATLPQSLKAHARVFEDITDEMCWVCVEAV
jgi:predicted molibdopterin-dependent oxidoreductase YjgC